MNKKLKDKLSILVKLVVILSAFIVASYAWMTNNSKLKMDGLMISTRAVQNLSFSLDGGITWDDETSLNISENFKFNSEITGDGINLYVPATRRENGTPVSFRNATVNKDFLEFEIIFKSDNAASIFLSKDSFVSPTAGTEANDLFGKNVLRKSSMGDFSRDLIAGSVRVAFFENDSTTPNFVWAPNPNYELIKGANENTFSLNSTNKQNYFYLNPTNLNEEVVPNLKDNLNASYGTNNSNGDPSIVKIDNNEETKKVKVRIWVEGNDRETDTSLKGGIFRIYFNFIAITKTENLETPTVIKIDNTVQGLTTDMEYSIDYGNTWKTYDGIEPQFNIGDTLYIRYKETKDQFASLKQIIYF